MINFIEMDNEDFVFINKTSPTEDRAFSDFLKNRNCGFGVPKSQHFSFSREKDLIYA